MQWYSHRLMSLVYSSKLHESRLLPYYCQKSTTLEVLRGSLRSYPVCSASAGRRYPPRERSAPVGGGSTKGLPEYTDERGNGMTPMTERREASRTLSVVA